MKKVLLTAMTLLSVATSSVFGYYGANADWIDFLADGNQFRARTDKLGFVLGNGTIKGTFGFKAENDAHGSIFTSDYKDGKFFANFRPTVSAGIGYTSEAFGIGVGYNYSYVNNKLNQFSKKDLGLSIHTPVIAMNFLNNSLRIAVPVQIAVKEGETLGFDKSKYMGVSMDPQIRYYTGLDAFSEVRLTIKYGMNEHTAQDSTKTTVSSIGFELRTYFGAQVGDVKLTPFLKIVYDSFLDVAGKYGHVAGSHIAIDQDVGYVTAGSGFYLNDTALNGRYFNSNPWKLEVLPTLGMSASSDVVNIYVEAGLGYRALNNGNINNNIEHALRWNAYGELSVRPIKDLEWYLESEIGNGDVYNGGAKSLAFNASSGLTWYLPSFQE